MLTVAQFRTDFPEFADSTLYPNALITTWLTVVAALITNTLAWGTLLTLGQELAVAHYLVLAARDLAAAAAGTPPGQVQGLQTANAVGEVSVSYDVASVSFVDAGFWNATTYGLRLYQLFRVIGAGGLQIWGCPDSFISY